MAAKSAKSRTAARKLRDKWKSKRWYSIRAPRNPHSFKVIGETLSENPENVVGRIHEVTQNEMDGDFTKMHIKLKFRVTEVLNQDAITEFSGVLFFIHSSASFQSLLGGLPVPPVSNTGGSSTAEIQFRSG